MKSALAGLLLLAVGPNWGLGIPGEQSAAHTRKNMALHVTSNAFAEGQSIPEKYTCDGQDISPPLKWHGAPPNTESFVLIVDDPDAPSGDFVHWVLYGLPPSTTSLTEASSGGGREGVNGFGKAGYGGPCPPTGGAHRYYFRVYALDVDSPHKPGLSKDEITRAMKGHILAEGELMGKYQRRK